MKELLSLRACELEICTECLASYNQGSQDNVKIIIDEDRCTVLTINCTHEGKEHERDT